MAGSRPYEYSHNEPYQPNIFPQQAWESSDPFFDGVPLREALIRTLGPKQKAKRSKYRPFQSPQTPKERERDERIREQTRKQLFKGGKTDPALPFIPEKESAGRYWRSLQRNKHSNKESNPFHPRNILREMSGGEAWDKFDRGVRTASTLDTAYSLTKKWGGKAIRAGKKFLKGKDEENDRKTRVENLKNRVKSLSERPDKGNLKGSDAAGKRR